MPGSARPPLRRADLSDDPIEQFGRWFDDAREAGQPEPEAMALATATPAGLPSVRFVLLRSFDHEGFVFFTNEQSRKGEEMATNPAAALALRWATVDRQVRVAGPVEPIGRDESDAYFAGRARGSQIGAWASAQSRPIESRAELERRFDEYGGLYVSAEVPRPPWWGGYRVAPATMEFWQQGVDRLHDRFQYRATPEGGWLVERLSP
jgi:pyridoxamine 5'-phosphate oxidase